MNRVVATLAVIVGLLFASVGIDEPEFFLLHCYEGFIYVILVTMLYYGREEWAYPLGMLLPLVWILLNFGTGRLSAGAVQLRLFVGRGEVTNLTSFLAVAITAAGLALAGSCAYYYWKEVHGSPSDGPENFALAALISLSYYAVLVLWFIAAVS
jgi:hypothetical protein